MPPCGQHGYHVSDPRRRVRCRSHDADGRWHDVCRAGRSRSSALRAAKDHRGNGGRCRQRGGLATTGRRPSRPSSRRRPEHHRAQGEPSCLHGMSVSFARVGKDFPIRTTSASGVLLCPSQGDVGPSRGRGPRSWIQTQERRTLDGENRSHVSRGPSRAQTNSIAPHRRVRRSLFEEPPDQCDLCARRGVRRNQELLELMPESLLQERGVESLSKFGSTLVTSSRRQWPPAAHHLRVIRSAIPTPPTPTPIDPATSRRKRTASSHQPDKEQYRPSERNGAGARIGMSPKGAVSGALLPRLRRRVPVRIAEVEGRAPQKRHHTGSPGS